MQKLRRTPEAQAFEEIMGCLKKATKQAKEANQEIEESKQKVRHTIESLLEEIEGIPEI